MKTLRNLLIGALALGGSGCLDSPTFITCEETETADVALGESRTMMTDKEVNVTLEQVYALTDGTAVADVSIDGVLHSYTERDEVYDCPSVEVETIYGSNTSDTADDRVYVIAYTEKREKSD